MKGLIPEFIEMVKKECLKAFDSLYPDGTLRHVGWLGAVPPAIKDLPDFAFGGEAGMTIEFEKINQEKGGNMLEKMKQKLSDMMNQIKEMMNMMPGQEEGESDD